MKRVNAPFAFGLSLLLVLLTACGGGGGGGGDNNNNDNDQNGGGTGGGGGTFWSDFVVPDQGCVDLGGPQICGPWKVKSATLWETSTGEYFGMCDFSAGSKVSAGAGPGGYEFFCERKVSGATTTITVTSEQANLLVLRANIIQDKEENAIAFGELDFAATIVNRNDGTAYSDPYAQKDFKFAGKKSFTFTSAQGKTMAFYDEHGVKPFTDAGYSASKDGYQANRTTVLVHETIDGRALLQDRVESLWKLTSTRGNTAEYDYLGKYQGTAKATMVLPIINAKVWEITANVTFEYDPAIDFGGGIKAFNTTGGTVTQTIYTSPNPACTGTPATFTDTYNIVANDGYLSLMPEGDPVQYSLSASLSDSTPIEAHTYTLCCPGLPCTTETIEVGAQQHTWMFMNHQFEAAQADGSLKGSYTWQSGANSFEWDLKPVTESE